VQNPPQLVRTLLVCFVAATGLLIVGCDSGGSSGSDSGGDDNSRIAFNGDQDGKDGIYTVHADGSDLKWVAGSSDLDLNPTWSPDGDRIALLNSQDGDLEIYTISLDGTDLRQVTKNSFDDYDPAWSPGGNRIAFWNIYGDGDGEIYAIRPNGEDLKQVTNNDVVDSRPAWSPNGNRIAFESSRDRSDEIYTRHLDGSDPKRIANYRNSNPAWGPPQ